MAEPATPQQQRQTAGDVLVIRPLSFSGNEVTKPTNSFQADDENSESALIGRAAVAEFNAAVATLVAHGVNVHLFEGRNLSTLPDEVFPNNWISTHDDGTVVLYPLFAWNRRDERRRDILSELQQRTDGFRIERVIDLSILEGRDHFLEGTGSLVLDRRETTAYACRSQRTHAPAMHVFCQKLDYKPILFDAIDRNGRPVYHTNVMMSLGDEFALACLESIREIKDRYRVLRRLEGSGREVIEISMDQMHAFAGNLIELQGRNGKLILISSNAARSLSANQLAALGGHGEVVTVQVGTIEKYGGGSIRCMLAEIFLPRKQPE